MYTRTSLIRAPWDRALPVSQGSSSNHVSYHLFDEVSLAAIARVQDKQESTDGNVWITQVDSDQ